MFLVDSSIWIDHLRNTNSSLQELLIEDGVLCHTAIIGEIALGNLKHRKEVISLLMALPKAAVAQTAEVFSLIENHRLHGTGIGWVDAHLLASAKLSHCSLWTFDKMLNKAAIKMAIAIKK